MDFDAVIKEANRVMEIPLNSRDLQDLTDLTLVQHRLSVLIPLIKRDLKQMELEADTLEKQTIINLRKSWIKMNVEEMKSQARILKNELLLKSTEVEFQYITLYQFYQDIKDQIASTRLVLKL